MRKSHTVENVSRFVIAFVGAACLLGAVAWAFVAFDNGGCSGGIKCHTAAELSQPHY